MRFARPLFRGAKACATVPRNAHAVLGYDTADVDVVVETFRPGGDGPARDRLRATQSREPRPHFACSSGYVQTGYSQRPGAPWLAEYETNEQMYAPRDLSDKRLSEIFLRDTTEAWIDRQTEHGGVVRTRAVL